MMRDLVGVSVSIAIVILIMAAAMPLLKRCGAKWRCIIWLLLAVRLLIPVNFGFISISVPAFRHEVKQAENTPESFEQKIRDTAAGFSDTEPAELTKSEQLPEKDQPNRIPAALVGDILTAVWAAGAVLLLLYHLISNLAFRLRIRPYMRAEGDYHGIQLYRCGRIQSPFMMGLIKPVIILPEIEYTPEEKAMILKHEYIHCRRKDLWYKLLMIVSNAVHWFNPCVWLMKRMAFRDMEFACDDAVCSEMDLEERKSYSMALLRSMG